MSWTRGIRLATAIATLAWMQAGARAADLTLHYDQPAANNAWDSQALPIGNGRMGAMLFGGIASDRIQFNEISLWTGSENVMGAYQAFGNLTIALPEHAQGTTGYSRQLNLEDGTAQVTYAKDGVDYRREYLASNPAQVVVVRLTASRPGMYSGSVDLADMHNAPTVAAGGLLSSTGALTSATGARGGRAGGAGGAPAAPGAKTMDYESQVQVLNEGGTIAVEGTRITFTHCDALTIILGARTGYVEDYTKNFMGDPPHAKLSAEIKSASGQPYSALRAAHVKDYQSLFGRVQYNFGTTSPEKQSMPTDKRLIDYTANPRDPGLEAIVAQYGRYLLMSCSRSGLPANLQGLWNNVNNPPWNADYHTNINIEMNYWSAEVGNLSETHLALFDLTEALEEPFRKATAAEPTIAQGKPVTGWTMRTSHNIFGNESYTWMMGSNAWYAHHFWEHYQFTQDKAFLKDHAYPMMREACLFWEDHLKLLADGRLVVPNGWSPEHGPHDVDGVMIDQEMVWDLFSNTAAAADVLGVDKDLHDKLLAQRDKLATPKIGSWGQLCEWLDELKDPVLDTPNDHHRHVSHLWGVYPGFQISPQLTPDLAKAAKVSLIARGTDADSRRSWTWPWRCAIAARLQDGELAYSYLNGLMTKKSSGSGTMMNMLPNLLTTHTPLQLDGNFGIAGAVPEILVQSQTGEIVLLPALPAKEWPTGSVKGLMARGAFEVDEQWADGKLTSATIRSAGANGGTTAKVRYGDKVVTVTMPVDGQRKLDASLNVLP